jgi:hypothetical protein
MNQSLFKKIVAFANELDAAGYVNAANHIDKLVRQALKIQDLNKIVEQLTRALHDKQKDAALKGLEELNHRVNELVPITGSLKRANVDPALGAIQQIDPLIPRLFSEDEKEKKEAAKRIRDLISVLKKKLTLREQLG